MGTNRMDTNTITEYPMTNSISVVIPAHNEEALITACISSVMESAEFAAIGVQLILVDDASSDKTSEIASLRGCTVLNVAFHSRAKARNFGAKFADGTKLYFIDADTVVSKSFFLDSYNLFSSGKSVFFYPQQPLEKQRFVAPYFTLLNYFSKRHPLLSPVIACTKEYFHSAGGFDEKLGSFEDFYFLRQAWRSGVCAFCNSTVRTSVRRIRKFGYFRATVCFLQAVINPVGYRWKEINTGGKR
jgi:glycosyltransferase involved in cell wall biosynthesis